MIALLHSLNASHRTTECSKLIDAILKENTYGPDTVNQALLVKALISRKRGKIQESLQILKDLKSRDATNAFTLFYHKALCFNSLQDYGNAESTLLQALALERHELVMLELGNIYILQNNFDSALYVYEEAIKLLYLRIGDSEKALNLAQLAVNQDPENLDALKTVITSLQSSTSMTPVLKNHYKSAFDFPLRPRLVGQPRTNTEISTAQSCLQKALTEAPLQTWEAPYNLGLFILSEMEVLERLQFVVSTIKDMEAERVKDGK
ncbi:hypothetical protein BCR33DRAFT_713404 [Rhizoclosmatium globosum]|uniref:TPR-like protein n=1 Tax=Rhizoclosmatium globosum TaxID=329046 RepID=A0A1Y2CS15_9FUNG|nr:hypothetical protein BCR33DRAFT_713404 [Rhizoclosmatium globosum]|eukprot:ORY49791.1 hypothetical protein BCR33DRAFT_713404 [Rhizoclosmatium globosum]